MGNNHTMMKILIAALILIAISVFLYWSNKSIVITRYKYESADVPKQFDGFRIAQVSDLQSEYFGKDQANLIAKVRETKPDAIMITGDILDRNHTNYDAAWSAVSQLLKIAPVYYVNGNHELALDEATMQDFYQRMRDDGVNVLMDEVAAIDKDGGTIYIAGLSEYVLYESRGDADSHSSEHDPQIIKSAVDDLTKDIDPSDFVVMLAHEPQFIDDYADSSIDLILSGHAHGGQIRLPFTQGLYAPGQGTLPKLTSGMHKSGSTTMVISRGLGNSVFPFRIFNRPEVVEVTLEKK